MMCIVFINILSTVSLDITEESRQVSSGSFDTYCLPLHHVVSFREVVSFQHDSPLNCTRGSVVLRTQNFSLRLLKVLSCMYLCVYPGSPVSRQKSLGAQRAAWVSGLLIFRLRGSFNFICCKRLETHTHTHTHARTHARTHALTHARTHALTHTKYCGSEQKYSPSDGSAFGR